jgi:hypothetical protein
MVELRGFEPREWSGEAVTGLSRFERGNGRASERRLRQFACPSSAGPMCRRSPIVAVCSTGPHAAAS